MQDRERHLRSISSQGTTEEDILHRGWGRNGQRFGGSAEEPRGEWGVHSLEVVLGPGHWDWVVPKGVQIEDK